MKTSPKFTLGKLALSSAIAAAVVLTAPQALAKKKGKDQPQNNPQPSGDLVKWDTKQDITGFGKLKVQGVVSYGIGGLTSNQIAVRNQIRFSKANLDIQCKAVVTSKSQMCINMVTKKIEGGNNSDLNCTVTGMNSDFGKMPADPKLSVCMQFKLTGPGGQAPKGTMKLYAEGGAAGAYKNVTLAKKDFK